MSNAMLTWTAAYKDGTVLHQYNGDGTENRYEDIDRYRLFRFDLLRGGEIVYSVYLHSSQRLIFRRRNFIPQGGERWVVYLVGWQMNVEGKNVTAINYIYPNGKIDLDNSRSDIQIREQEL